MRDFDTPAKLRRAWFNAKLKTLKCANLKCRAEFKQKSTDHRFCSQVCMMTPRAWQPKVKQIFDDLYDFCKKHSIPRAYIIADPLWQDMCREARQYSRRSASDKLRSRFAVQFKMVMDRFRRGFYIVTQDGIQFQNPPWLPYCPVDHTYCRGVVLPHDCPRRHPECAYTNGTWKEICQLRGLYEIDVDKNAIRNFSGHGGRGRGGRPLIGYKVGKSNDPRPRPNATAVKAPRPKTADGSGLSS
jgi:hypothetical protein